MSYQVDGVEFGDKVSDIRINLPWNGQATAATTFGNYTPDDPNPYQRIAPDVLGLRHHNRGVLDNNIGSGLVTNNQSAVFGSVDKVVRVNITSMGLSTNHMPYFLGGGWQDSLLKGSYPAYDFGYFLDIDGAHMLDILESTSKTQGMQTAHSALQQIFAKYGIASYDLRFKNHAIKQLRRSTGKPSDWIAKIRRVRQSGIRFRGATAVIAPYTTGGPVWRFTAGQNFSEFTWREADQPPNNRFILTRVDPVKGRVGGQRCSGGSCPGRTVKFAISPPSGAIRTTIKVDPGGIKDWVFVGEDGVFRQGTTLGAYQGPPAVEAIATYEPTFLSVVPGSSSAGYTPYYEINAYGADASDVPTQPYRLIFNDPATQGAYGIWQDYANIEDPIIATGADLNAYGNAVLLESVRHCYSGILKTPFINAIIEPGQFIWLVCPMSVMHNTRWFIEAVSYNLANGTDWTMELALSKGLV
jgi:hypothetical protein